MPNTIKHTVLIADDDEEDRFLVMEAFETNGTQAAFACVADGMELMLHLSGTKSDQLPNLILLDLNMPRKDGREALIEIRSETSYQHIPIVILTTSGNEKDMTFSLHAGANEFIIKPASFDEWVLIMKHLTDRWLTI